MAPETGLILRKPRGRAPAHWRSRLFLILFPIRRPPAPRMRPKPPRHPHPGRRAAASPWPVPRGRLAWLTGAISTLLLVASTLFWCLLLFPLALLKLLLPRGGPTAHRSAAQRHRHGLGQLPQLLVRAHPARALGRAGQYRPALRGLVSGQLQSPVLGGHLRAASHVEPAHSAAEVFLKQQLIYVPVIGLAWWALDFPFMKRHGKADLRRNPALGRQDQEAARRACEKFSLVPTSVMIFAEGTGFQRPSAMPRERRTAICSSPRQAGWRWRSTPWARASVR